MLAESVMRIAGERWLVEQANLSGIQDSIPADRYEGRVIFFPCLRVLFFTRFYCFARCTLLVLETSRVEIAVLLNDLAYLRYESKEALDAETVILKQRNLAIAFSLVEKIVKLIASIAEDEGMHFYFN